MNEQSTCPDERQWQAYQLGGLAAPDAAGIVGHLRACAACRARAAAPASLQTAGEALPLQAFDETRNLESPLQITGAQAASSRPVSPAPAPYSFLQAPEKAGELGRLGNFRVLRLLGQGGMGMVFKAEDIALRRPIALKVLKPELHGQPEILQRFIFEARALAALKHENLVTIHQAGQENGTFFLAMELLEGEALAQWMARVGPAEVRDILRLGRAIAAGLAAIHRRGLVHRDLKPSNIWLEAPRGLVKILDFGLVRSVKESAPLTEHGIILGTPTYMSPEQARGDSVDARSDLFNLGILLYALCTGVRPFQGDTTLALLTAIVTDTPRDILALAPRVPRELADLVMQLLAKKAGDRPASADQVIESLRHLERSPQPSQRPQSQAVRVVEAAPRPEPAELPSLPTRPAPPRRKTAARSRQVSLPAILLGCLGVLALLALAVGISSNFSLPSATPPSQLAVVQPKATGKAAVPTTTTPKLKTGKTPVTKPAVEPPEPRPLPDPLPEPVPEPKLTYLSELKPAAAENWPVFRSVKVAQPPKVERIMVKGELSPHGIFMHPPPLLLGRFASVSYKLDKKFTAFRTAVSLLDGAPPGAAPVHFAVHGDKLLLHEFKPVATQNDTQRAALSVKGVDLLTLSVTTKGADVRGALAVWLEPVLQE